VTKKNSPKVSAMVATSGLVNGLVRFFY